MRRIPFKVKLTANLKTFDSSVEQPSVFFSPEAGLNTRVILKSTDCANKSYGGLFGGSLLFAFA